MKAWIALAVCLVYTVIGVWFIHRFTKSSLDESQSSISYWTLFFIGICTIPSGKYRECGKQFYTFPTPILCGTIYAGLYLRNNSFHFRLACVFACMGFFIISNYFTASFTSLISVPLFRLPVNSIEELANSQTVKTLLLKGSSTDEYFLVIFAAFENSI